MISEKRLKKVDVILLVLFPIMAVVVSLLIKANYLVSILLFFGLPAAWLSYRTQHMIAKSGFFALTISIPLTILGNSIAVLNDAWRTTSMFSYRVFGVFPVEDFLWSFMGFYLLIIFYEHFLNKGKHELVDERMKYFVWPAVFLVVLFLFVLFLKPDLLVFKYSYLLIGFVFVLLPVVTFLSFFSSFNIKICQNSKLFFYLEFYV